MLSRNYRAGEEGYKQNTPRAKYIITGSVCVEDQRDTPTHT